MNTSIALDDDLPMPLPADESSDEDVLASGRSMTRGNASLSKPQPKLSSGPACSVKIPRSAPLQDPSMSAYDSMDADPNLATTALRGSSAELPTSLVTRMQAEGHLSLLEYYSRAIIRRVRKAIHRSRRRCWCSPLRVSGKMRGELGRTRRRCGLSWRTRRIESTIFAPAFSVPI
jgi:hypothetical protein